MKTPGVRGRVLVMLAAAAVAAPGARADEQVTAMVYARTAPEYRRERTKDGAFKPEFYALANGGRVAGTLADGTVERVTYPEVADVAVKLLAAQNYRYAQTKEQAKLLLMLQWGNTIGFNRSDQDKGVNDAAGALGDLNRALVALGLERVGGIRGAADVTINPNGGGEDRTQIAQAAATDAAARFESAMVMLFNDNQVRDQINERNAKILGYTDELADSNDIRRWAGGGDRFTDLLADVEEGRYYIIVTAYDFERLTKHNERKVLWVTKVSVRSPGNRFDDSMTAMMKSAAKYFGQDRSRLIRDEQTKGTVEMGDIKFIGEAKEPTKESRK
jgi:hypothetical protein